MNWSRTKSIFIVAFLILNSFLGYQLWEKQTNKIELAQIYENSIEELLLLKNIALETALSVEQPEMSQLNAEVLRYRFEDISKIEDQAHVFDKGELSSQFSSPIPLSDQWSPDEFYEQVVDKEVLYGNQYTLDQHTETEIIYLQQVQKHPVFISTLAFQKNEEQDVTGYNQIYYHIINQGTEQRVISSLTSIRTLLDNQIIPSYAIIKDVGLGYYGQVYDADSQVLSPVWRIVIEHEENRLVIYVNAITGAIESVPTS